MQNVQFVSSLWGEELNPSTSAGLVGEEWKEASAGKVNNTCDGKFEKTDKEASIKQHIVWSLNTLVVQILWGQEGQQARIKCHRLTKNVVDVSNARQVDQVRGQIQSHFESLYHAAHAHFIRCYRTSTFISIANRGNKNWNQKRRLVKRMVNLALPVSK